jgi:hypothetical protein
MSGDGRFPGAKIHRSGDNHHSMDAPERFEQLIAFLSANLPSPVDQHPDDEGGIVFTGGEPGQVVVHLTESNVAVYEYAGNWESPYAFSARPRRVGILKWRRLPETALMNALEQLIKGAREMRLARYRACRFCEKPKPPEWLRDEVCQQCSARTTDVIH